MAETFQFNDLDLMIAMDMGYGGSDDDLDHETYERLSKIFSKINHYDQGLDPDLPHKTSSLRNAAERLEQDLVEKALPGKRTVLYKLAAEKLATMMLAEAMGGLSTSWDTKSGGALKTERQLGINEVLSGRKASEYGMAPQLSKATSPLFNVSLDLSNPYDFLAKSGRIGRLPPGHKQDISKIIFKTSAMRMAKDAVSDIITDIYLNKTKRSEDDNDDKISSEILAGINKLIGSIQQLNLLKRMIVMKLAEINRVRDELKSKINLDSLQSLNSYLNELIEILPVLMQEINLFMTIPTRGILVGINGDITNLIYRNKAKQQEIVPSIVKSIGDQSFRLIGKLAWREDNSTHNKERVGYKIIGEDTLGFSESIRSNQSFFFQIEYILKDTSNRIGDALNAPFEKIQYGSGLTDLLDSSFKMRNLSYDSDMTQGGRNLSASEEAKNVEINASRLINVNETSDGDILEIMYSITDNLSLVFGDDDLNDTNINKIKSAISKAVFERGGLENEIGDYLTKQVEASFDVIFQDHSMSGTHAAPGRFS
jgi:hypothetical protein